MSILKFLGLGKSRVERDDTSEVTATAQKITEELDHMDPHQARFLATFAYILSRVANADLSISKVETCEMERIVIKYGVLPDEQAIMVVQMAKTQSLLFGETENFLVTREFNKLATRDQKTALLKCLFAVSSADRSVSSAEEAEIRQIVAELKLEHADFIKARLAFKEHLQVLKNPPYSSH